LLLFTKEYFAVDVPHKTNELWEYASFDNEHCSSSLSRMLLSKLHSNGSPVVAVIYELHGKNQ
jgi:hypothetical protein